MLQDWRQVPVQLMYLEPLILGLDMHEVSCGASGVMG